MSLSVSLLDDGAKYRDIDLPQAKLFPPTTTPLLPKGTFDGKVVFVSGGGTGLGKGMTKRFSQLGAKVAIASR